jgi:hypothetical protein
MVGLLILVSVVVTAWMSFTLGRATSVRRTNLNHHKMMMLLMDLRGRDETVPIMSAPMRAKLERLLTDYERLDVDQDRS